MFKGIIPILKDFTKKNSTLILGIAGCTGTIAAMILTADATIKAEKLLKDDDVSAMTKTEIAKKTWKCYIPAITVGVFSIACTAGTSIIGRNTQASLALVATSYEAYCNKVKKIYGDAVHERIMNSIAESNCKPPFLHCNDFMSDSTLDISGKTAEPEVVRTFYDSYSKRYFESTMSNVIQAFYHFNRNYMMFGCSSVNDLYCFLGLDDIPEGDSVGWEIDDEISWIDFNHTVTRLDDGMEVVQIDYIFEPYKFHENSYTYF